MPVFTEDQVNSLLKDADEKEVVRAIIKQVDAYGENSKQAYTELRETVKQMQDKVNKSGEKYDEQLKKFVDDIIVRQAAQDTQAKEFVTEQKKRLDEIEVFIQEHGKGLPEGSEETEALIKQFYLETRSVKQEDNKFNRMKDFDYNQQLYTDYKKSLEIYLRSEDKFFNTQSDAIKALSLGIDPHGGYTVTPTMSNRILQRMYEMDPIRSMANVETISQSDAWEILASWGQFGYGWVGETEDRDETSTGDLKKIRIPVHEMYASPYATQIIIEDSARDIEGWVSEQVADRFARVEGAAFVTGNGAKCPRGFLTYANYDTAGTDQFGRIEQIAMGAATTVTADGFYNLKFSLLEELIETATWLMNKTTLRDTLKLKDGEGRYLWSPGLAKDNYSTILGRPVRMATSMPTLAASALSVAYADWRKAYTIVDRMGISVLRDPYSNKPFVEFYTRKRVGGDVTDFQAIKLGIISV